MNRSRRQNHKPFVAGGVYDPRQLPVQQQPQQYNQSFSSNLQYVQPVENYDTSAQEPQHMQDMAQFSNPEPPTQDFASTETDANFEGGKIEEDPTSNSSNPKGYFRKIFGFRKKPSVRAKEKKIRQNRRLRKVLLPKNALMALHEVKGIKIEDFIISNGSGGGFIATVSVNGNQYEGKGSSKNTAKNNACEKALRDLVITKMLQKPASKSGSVENIAEDIEMKENTDDEDELPMVNLASFALFKLFSEWEAEGFEIPEFRPQQQNGNNSDGEKVEKPKKTPSIRSELPQNWETMHPATLLCMMRPGLNYVELGCEGKSPNITQKIGVTVDDQHFIGTGRSKKIARKNAAVNACNALFRTNFEQFLQ